MVKLSVLSAVETFDGALDLKVGSGAESGGGDATFEDGGGVGNWAGGDCGV